MATRARWAGRLALAAMIVGAAIRVEEFSSRRSLWVDEALVANNVVARDFAGLVRPLSGEQGAPIGWLWSQRLAVLALGNNEYALRAIPLAAGVLALYLTYRVAKRVVSPLGAAAVTWLVALSPAAVRYSVEVKQYSSDLGICLLITLLALRGLPSRRRFDPGALWVWGGVGAIAVWCAHPAVLVLVGGGAVLGAEAVRRRDAAGVRAVVVACTPWLLTFGAVWLVALRRLGRDTFLRAYWAAGLAPRPLRAPTFTSWLTGDFVHLVADPAKLAVVPLAAALAAAGLGVLIFRRPAQGMVVAAPLIAGIAAATVGGFPLRGRLALWLLPLAFLGVGSIGTAMLPVRLGRARARTAIAVAALLAGAVMIVAVVPAIDVVTLTRERTVWSDIRPLLQAIRPKVRSGDQIWVHEPDSPAAAYYAVAVGVTPTHVLHSPTPPAGCLTDQDLTQLGHGGRVWFIYGYRLSTAPPGEQAAILASLDSRARMAERIARPEATAWLYDFARPPAAPAPVTLPCLSLTPATPPAPTGLSGGPFGRGPPT